MKSMRLAHLYLVALVFLAGGAKELTGQIGWGLIVIGVGLVFGCLFELSDKKYDSKGEENNGPNHRSR